MVRPPVLRVEGVGTLANDPMAARVAALTALAALLLAGCGSGTRHPQLSSVPLVSGARVVARHTSCNKGANAYCAIELVVSDQKYESSRSLVLAERDALRHEGWVGASPYTGLELADESPHDKLRVTYATAVDDLQGLELGWIDRAWPIEAALDLSLFERSAAMSVLVEVGSR
jgi:hypothetical protein